MLQMSLDVFSFSCKFMFAHVPCNVSLSNLATKSLTYSLLYCLVLGKILKIKQQKSLSAVHFHCVTLVIIYNCLIHLTDLFL